MPLIVELTTLARRRLSRPLTLVLPLIVLSMTVRVPKLRIPPPALPVTVDCTRSTFELLPIPRPRPLLPVRTTRRSFTRGWKLGPTDTPAMVMSSTVVFASRQRATMQPGMPGPSRVVTSAPAPRIVRLRVAWLWTCTISV
ncbi:MAG: hypothetical protein AB1689_05070 [Thermodesulfobacteriota bacterium]